MGKLREFMWAVFSHWEPLVSGVATALLFLALNYLYEQRHGSGMLPWYWYVFVALVFLFYACYRVWRDQAQKHEQDIQHLKDTYRHTEEILRQEIAHLTNELAGMKAPQLQFEFPEAELDRSNLHTLIIFVRVRNLTVQTIEKVSVRIVSIIQLDELEDPDYARYLKTLIGLPLMIRGGGPLLPEGELPHETAIYSEDAALFNVLLLELPYPFLLHAVRSQSPRLANGTGGAWRPFPPMELRPGRYHLQLKAQGKDTPPATLTVEFMHVSDEMWVRQVKEPASFF